MIETTVAYCLVCEEPIPHRRYQDPKLVRTCKPLCAQTLAMRENPEFRSSQYQEADE